MTGKGVGAWGDRKEESSLFIKSLLGASFPPPLELNLIFGPQCQAESRGVIKNLILVGSIIVLVALVRHLSLLAFFVALKKALTSKIRTCFVLCL